MHELLDSSIDGIEVWRVGRHITQRRVGRFDRLAHASDTMDGDVVHHVTGCSGLARRVTSGILYGIDYGVWASAHDAALLRRYVADGIAGKNDCKVASRREIKLSQDADVPLVAYVHRSIHQKERPVRFSTTQC